MKNRSPDFTSYLTEGERRIAEQVKKLRDLRVRRDVLGGGGSQPLPFSGATASRTEVKDSHDR